MGPTVPFEFRLLLAAKPEPLSAIGRIFVQEIQRWQREHARALGYERPETAAVSFCQRFGSSLNLNIHWHVNRIKDTDQVRLMTPVQFLARLAALVSPPTPDGAQAPSLPHPSSPKPLLPSAAALPGAEAAPLAPSHAAGEAMRFSRLSRLAWATLYQRVGQRGSGRDRKVVRAIARSILTRERGT